MWEDAYVYMHAFLSKCTHTHIYIYMHLYLCVCVALARDAQHSPHILRPMFDHHRDDVMYGLSQGKPATVIQARKLQNARARHFESSGFQQT